MKEADMNLGIALKFRDILAAQGANVIMTRTTDKLVSLIAAAIANNNKVDILLSIHFKQCAFRMDVTPGRSTVRLPVLVTIHKQSNWQKTCAPQ